MVDKARRGSCFSRRRNQRAVTGAKLAAFAGDDSDEGALAAKLAIWRQCSPSSLASSVASAGLGVPKPLRAGTPASAARTVCGVS
jgi:hypothetical protein